MNRILLALVILVAGTGGFLAAHNLTSQLTREMNAHRDVWLAQTQQLAAVQGEQADLEERMRRLKVALAQYQPVSENALWSALKTNRADRLSPELRERVLEELGFNWQFSPDFIVVTKQALRDTRSDPTPTSEPSRSWIINDGRLSETAVSILALTPEERGQVEAVLQQAKAEINDWTPAHLKRTEPANDVVADYFLPGNRGLCAGVSNNLALAIGTERTDLILDVSREQMASEIGVSPDRRDLHMLIRRELVGNEQRLEAVLDAGKRRLGYLPQVAFPGALRAIFPNGWSDVAKREGFDLPEKTEQK